LAHSSGFRKGAIFRDLNLAGRNVYQNIGDEETADWQLVAQGLVVTAAGEFETAGGDSDEAIPVEGALPTDVAIVTVKAVGASPVTVVTAAADEDEIAVSLSDDPDDDHVLSYVLIRP
jgi:hypothetical protein